MSGLEDKPVELWTYGGATLTSDNALGTLWVDPHDRQLVYKRLKGSVVGGIYRVRVERTDDGAVNVYGIPEWTGEVRGDEVALVYQAADSIARTRHRQLRNEANQAKQNALDEAIEPLRAIARKARTSAERDALVATIIRRVSREWR